MKGVVTERNNCFNATEILCTSVRQERQVSGKLVIEFITVVIIFIQLAYWESIVMNILILIMNIISGLTPAKTLDER